MSTSSLIGIAAFAVDRSGRRCLEIEEAPRARGASVVKPLLFWVGATAEPFATNSASWAAIARPAVTVSDNDATAALWSRVGERRLLAALEDRAGVRWRTGGDGEHPALRVMVTAGELACTYAAFASDESDEAGLLRRWMRDVPTEQTFGVRRVACEALGVPERTVGVKCGWFGLERAHAVVLVALPNRSVGAAITTVHPSDPESRAQVQEMGGNDTALVAAHDAVAGPSIRSATRRALELATEL
jgi:hypothetical protein